LVTRVLNIVHTVHPETHVLLQVLQILINFRIHDFAFKTSLGTELRAFHVCDYVTNSVFYIITSFTTGTQEDKQRFVNLLHAKLDRGWDSRENVSQARRTPRRPDIYAYVQDLGINSSLIHPHYELPISMVASSRKNKSRQGITIRKNKQPVSLGQSSNSHLNRTESSHSNNETT
jgi:hypothetical protein